MKSRIRFLSILVAAALAGPALAGEIVKCVDTDGHVTLTDQACEAGNTSVRLASEGDDTAPQHRAVAVTNTRAVWKRPAAAATSGSVGFAGNGGGANAAPARLSLDVATLKAAHRTMLMQDAKPRLANLD